jgi:hypothetical protein
MPNDLAVQPLTAVRANTEIGSEAKAPVNLPPFHPEPTANPSPVTNPSLRLDPALGIVVLEFHNDAGAVTTSVPSQRQLQAYQKWDVTHFGPTPVGLQKPPTPTLEKPAAEPKGHS